MKSSNSSCDFMNENQLYLFESDRTEIVNKIKRLSKVEMHRHLTGSITTEIAIKTALKYHVDLPSFINSELDKKLSLGICNNNLKEYFKSWEILNQLFVNPDAVYEIVRDIIYDAYLDNISYLELRMAPRWFLGTTKYQFPEFLNAFNSAVEDSFNDYGLITRGILGIPRHVFIKIPTDNRIRMFNRIISDLIKFGKGYFVGIDLNGDELESGGQEFKSFFEIGKKNGLGITIHAGEVGSAENVKYAIESLEAKRIGHGIAALADINIIKLIKDREVTLELCPTSNQLLGLYNSYEKLPVRKLINEGILFGICTDNPARCKISLSEELIKIVSYFNLSFEEVIKLEEMKINAVFESSDIKKKLLQKLLLD